MFCSLSFERFTVTALHVSPCTDLPISSMYYGAGVTPISVNFRKTALGRVNFDDSSLRSAFYYISLRSQTLCLGDCRFAAVSLGLPLPALSQELAICANEGSPTA